MQTLTEKATGRLFACPTDNMSVPGAQGTLARVDKISNLRSIDWGPHHCLFVDQKYRVFAMGLNQYGITGLAPPEPELGPSERRL